MLVPTRPEPRSLSGLNVLPSRIVNHFDEPIASCRVTSETEGTPGANDVRFTIQVVDRVHRPWEHRWVVRAWIADTADGDPTAVASLTVTSGFEMQAIIANSMVDLLTEADGTAQVVANYALAGSKYLHAAVLGIARAGVGQWT